MAACGGLKHIFEHSVPEPPTLLGSLSSWKQINPAAQIQPIEQSSVTEIFGELHFKENSELPSPSFPIPPFSSAILKHSSREDENNIGSSSSPKVAHKKSFSLNSESLHVCTEGHGFESRGDVGDNDAKNEMEQEWQRSKEKIDKATRIVNEKRWNVHGELKVIKSRRSNSLGDFPPPISCIGKSGKPTVSFKSYRQDGRFVLKQVKTPTQEFLHACREDGRLKLQFMQPNDKSMEDAIDDDGKEKR
ncbi:hypothetical protein like AT5G22390 [Hibiscus trionum]|uniref:FAF domain-containing protein n=1 Tax=Hibiscus trionum TaxID=183268 RepID=A0A9W7MEI8_HIBTR|nr:hypothetical protein like AT5G22390 [Hibiscus trionum]